jgi:hypothetical protein
MSFALMSLGAIVTQPENVGTTVNYWPGPFSLAYWAPVSATKKRIIIKLTEGVDGTEEVFIEKFEVRVIHGLGPMLQNFLHP